MRLTYQGTIRPAMATARTEIDDYLAHYDATAAVRITLAFLACTSLPHATVFNCTVQLAASHVLFCALPVIHVWTAYAEDGRA